MNIYSWRGRKKFILMLLLALIAIAGVLFSPEKEGVGDIKTSTVQAEK